MAPKREDIIDNKYDGVPNTEGKRAQMALQELITGQASMDTSDNSPSTEGAKQEVAISPANGFMALIEKVAMLPGKDTVDSLERMMKMQMEWEDRQEERDFNNAIERIVGKLAHIRIVKSKSVGYDIDKNDKSKGQKEAFRYTPIEEIEKIVRPLLAEENIRPAYTCKPSGMQGMYEVTCTLKRGRQSTESCIPLPMDTSGGKNNAQGMGSTFSYGKRYALCAALFITTVGEDNDAAGAPITEEQSIEIKQGLMDTGLDTKKFLKTLKIESVDEMATKDYRRAMNLINATRWEQLPENAKGKKE